MKLTSLVIFIASALAMPVSYDPIYDSHDTSLVGVACSNGDHGLMMQGYHTLGDVPEYWRHFIHRWMEFTRVWDVLEPDVYPARRGTEDGDDYCGGFVQCWIQHW